VPHVQIDASDRFVAAIALYQAADADHRLRMGGGGVAVAIIVFCGATIAAKWQVAAGSM
jgi:hypothetical protein